MTRARRKHPSKELVPVRNPVWDSQVLTVLDSVHRYSRTGPGGYQTPPETKRLMALDAAGRLEGLVAQRDADLQGIPDPQALIETATWPRYLPDVDDEAGF